MPMKAQGAGRRSARAAKTITEGLPVTGSVFVWENVRLNSGRNVLDAVAYFDGHELTDSAVIYGIL